MARVREFDTDAAVQRAMELFWRQGFEATSVRDLVDATGVGRGSLYAAFGSKEGLYEAALRRYVERTTRDMLERDAPAREVIRDFLLTLVDEAVTDGSRRGCLVTNAVVERLPHSGMTGRIVRDSLDGLRESVLAVLRRAADRRELPEEADLDALADFVVTTVQGLRVMGKVSPDRRVLTGVVDTAVRVLG
ncbi:transcriptional regulator, TetR family [Streptoalloteichus tenebrarius]|uniref:Transcriptional regulator, TetR family n=1 Tax=Streptoalloteichus tenebrarius (strain ATCC 17920 / DSM 40477 / JCM 4838 / CBS 697.72 / NBRC 16177 / NCIMB 11028 / NRRL B-12390 / A12253. 1 / ISP 5477) TaxID=1933 RepID=A0ABT1I3J4_STRSD|nr:TetR/AcrR family transcriptional regulator [Streptoalloteichus tenebrarius]MCP2262364.1 transcriptional regulator, TetR family [Streptoalloteichus tenebrarius]BFF00635.1 TetR/AcrR family transcriptional regulator [Streptoalloteichus tenebrarius]